MRSSREIARAMVLAAGTALATLSLVACDDSTGPDTHGDTAGFAIALDGDEVIRFIDGQGGSLVLTLEAGESYAATVTFLDEDGDPIARDGEDKSLRVTVLNTQLLGWTAGAEDPALLEFDGTLSALGPGGTTVGFCLLHDGHCDYESPQVTVSLSSL